MESSEKPDIPKELWRIASTLTQEAQEAAIRKCVELAFDTNRGRISLEETLINLSTARDIILDAVDKRKISQLPLKLQYSLLDQIKSASEELTSIINGKDAILPLEAAVEELTSSIWIYHLQNLSGEVLGFQTKMNQLKAEETQLRQASRQGKELTGLRERAATYLAEISSTASSVASEHKALQESLSKANEALVQSTDTHQKISALAAQVQQYEITTAQQVANVTQSAATLQATANNIKSIAEETTALRASLAELETKAQQTISSTLLASEKQNAALQSEFSALKAGTEQRTNELVTKTDNHIATFSTTMADRLDNANAAALKIGTDLNGRITQLYTETKARLDQAASTDQIRLDGQLKEFNALHQNAVSNLNDTLSASVKAFAAQSDAAMSQNKEAFDLRVKELDDLEGQIRRSIERATGFSLFHSFQHRQLEVARAKRFWAYALAAPVVVSLCASGVFIYSLKFVSVYNAAFYLKLSISIPLIYGIAFCNVQYSKERRLEEEYAFKSSISISLDPYQRLVKSLVDETKPEELAKYTAFVIDSVNKVFSSPTQPVFGGESPDVNTFQKITKSLGDFVEPIVRGLKK